MEQGGQGVRARLFETMVGAATDDLGRPRPVIRIKVRRHEDCDNRSHSRSSPLIGSCHGHCRCSRPRPRHRPGEEVRRIRSSLHLLPTADRFHAGFTAERYVDAIHARNHERPTAPLSLYVHVPFCNTICYYCACNKVITKDHGRSAKYIKYVGREIEIVSGSSKAARRSSNCTGAEARRRSWRATRCRR